MSFLSELHSYWASNGTLTALIPTDKVFTGLVPDSCLMPYAVIVPISEVPTFLCGQDYYESFHFQVSLFGDDDATIESTAQTVMDELDYVSIANPTIAVERLNYLFTTEPAGIFHVVLEYNWTSNRTLE